MKKDRSKLNRSQRMQIKAFICLLGFLLIVVLLLGKLTGALLNKGKQPEKENPFPEVHIPIVETIHNIWIMEEDEEGILVFYDGDRKKLNWGSAGKDGALFRPEETVREQLADVTLTDGRVTGIVLKKEKINGRILGIDEAGIEVEGYGWLPLAEDHKGYRLYDTLEMCTANDLQFGDDFTDFWPRFA